VSGVTLEPALRLLLARKLRGTLRRTWRRARTLRGAVVTLLGLVLVGLWIVAVVAGAEFGDGATSGLDPAELRGGVRVGLLAFLTISVGGAFVHRGLFLPQAEIERLFAAPLSRADLVRYRLLVHVARATVGGSVFALLVSRRLPSPVWGFLGALVAIQLLPVVNQGLAIIAGVLESRFAKPLAMLGKLLTVLLGLFVMAVSFLVVTGSTLTEMPGAGELVETLELRGEDGSLAIPGVVTTTARVFEPWARLITATSAFEFLTWLPICLAIWLLLFELTARLPVDFRELSLETSASVAARLRRTRRGGGAASGQAKRGAGWVRVPWVLGRGPTRAVAWRKLTTILRKARGTLWVSVLVLLFVTLLSSVLSSAAEPSSFRWDPELGRLVERDGSDPLEALARTLAPSLLVALLGVLYLSGGLRFDFREDLDRMESLRAWPIAPSRLFMATLVPQVALVSALVLLALALRVALTREFHPALFGLAAFVPPFALAWVALDNAVFLLLPVRPVPGQGGMIQNAGRAFLVIFLRMVLLGVVLLLGGLAGVAAFFLVGEASTLGAEVGLSAGAATAWGALLLVDVALLSLGGRLLARFDVARDVR